MNRTHARTPFLAAVASVLALSFASQNVSAQQPSPDQIAAIRASCRSDFIANCSGVQPGGKDALECLRRNVGKLSGPCKTAVSAVSPPPAAAASPPASAPAASPPPAAPPPAPAAAVSSPSATPAPAAKLTAKPQKATPAPPASQTASAPAAAAAEVPAVAPAVAPLTLRPVILPRRRLAIVRECSADVGMLCPDVPPGGGRILQCLAAQAANLSPSCYAALASVSRQ